MLRDEARIRAHISAHTQIESNILELQIGVGCMGADCSCSSCSSSGFSWGPASDNYELDFSSTTHWVAPTPRPLPSLTSITTAHRKTPSDSPQIEAPESVPDLETCMLKSMTNVFSKIGSQEYTDATGDRIGYLYGALQDYRAYAQVCYVT